MLGVLLVCRFPKFLSIGKLQSNRLSERFPDSSWQIALGTIFLPFFKKRNPVFIGRRKPGTSEESISDVWGAKLLQM